MPAAQKFRRKDLKKGENLCDHCTAKCCRYFALPIDTPKKREDFDHLRWYMIHGAVSLFVEDGVWYLMVHADCQHLQADNMCGIYHTRPQICRDYSTDNCEFDDDVCYEKFFETADQLWEYAEAILPQRAPAEREAHMQLPVLN
ncbi:Flagellin N-methylase [Polystyrenella longa]|uniref:Flagellin N-methylase n=1 Tax=Polystyrenella longa TaxID=2528007 RepID=A0A518CUE9_9PLAN|nr:YkgJ family cysteine cluster protein [Polystyrenella longa]QDU82814.1 Flagellin N-methylase [Polystyrenella longa]